MRATTIHLTIREIATEPHHHNGKWQCGIFIDIIMQISMMYDVGVKNTLNKKFPSAHIQPFRLGSTNLPQGNSIHIIISHYYFLHRLVCSC